MSFTCASTKKRSLLRRRDQGLNGSICTTSKLTKVARHEVTWCEALLKCAGYRLPHGGKDMGSRRQVRAHLGSEAFPKCTGAGEPCPQEARLSSKTLYGEDDEPV